MIAYQSKEKLVKFDTSIADRIVNIIEKRSRCKETVEELLEVLQQFFASKQEKEESITLERKETEDEAMSILGEDFVSKYNKILEYCKENKLLLYIHGTQPNIAQKILQVGLNYKIPSIESTAILQDLDNPKCADLLNWPHQHYEGLVLLGIPKESFGEIWNKKDNVSNQVTTYSYNIASEFLLGMVDIANRMVVLNGNFQINHDYNNLLKDNELAKKLERSLLYQDHHDFSQQIHTPVEDKSSSTSDDKYAYCDEIFANYFATSNVDECMDYAFDFIISKLVQFCSFGNIGKSGGWTIESDVQDDLELSKRLAKLLFEYKNYFITQRTLESYGKTTNCSCENDIADFTIDDNW